ncbi:response regulator receiver modulated diguanylate cyclase [Clostridium sp. CAG:967]|nr:response regulator receiver modulated diguanylate cyclase [Clostridium sp. CAG:967]
MEDINIKNNEFDIPSDILDEIQQNITNIIESFDIPDDNKNDVIKKINFMYTQTRQLSITDGLTNLYNRRHFEMTFDREFNRAKRYKSELSLAVIDIDLFKSFNDTYGHSCGDYVLKELAYLLVQNFRQTDLIFRYGGEEFVILLTETPLENAFIPLERLRKAVEENRFRYKGQDLKVTISGGISSNNDIENLWDMFDLADKALYKAKECGRNQIKLTGQ